eukprot:1158701-Pelagomonas_calceolata.AAC.14
MPAPPKHQQNLSRGLPSKVLMPPQSLHLLPKSLNRSGCHWQQWAPSQRAPFHASSVDHNLNIGLMHSGARPANTRVFSHFLYQAQYNIGLLCNCERPATMRLPMPPPWITIQRWAALAGVGTQPGGCVRAAAYE